MMMVVVVVPTAKHTHTHFVLHVCPVCLPRGTCGQSVGFFVCCQGCDNEDAEWGFNEQADKEGNNSNEVEKNSSTKLGANQQEFT